MGRVLILLPACQLPLPPFATITNAEGGNVEVGEVYLNVDTSDASTMANVTLPAANARITEIGLFDNENGNPDLMAIAKLQSPITRTGTQQFTITIDF